MEHRHGTREQINVETLLYRQGLPVAWGRIVNIGVGGAFVQFRNGMLLDNHTLELEFTARMKGRNHKIRTEAMVVHRSQAGIGIMFDSHDRNVVKALRRLVEMETQRAPDIRRPESEQADHLRSVRAEGQAGPPRGRISGRR